MSERRVGRSRELPINILHLLEFVTDTACWSLLADFFHLALESHSGLQTINNQVTARRNIRSRSCVRECIWQKLNFLFSSFKYGSIRRIPPTPLSTNKRAECSPLTNQKPGDWLSFVVFQGLFTRTVFRTRFVPSTGSDCTALFYLAKPTNLNNVLLFRLAPSAAKWK